MNEAISDALLFHRLQFAFTITFHYLFPQLTMGLSLIIVLFKGLHLQSKDEKYNIAAKFWAKIFAVNFVMGVITGIPMEFQFGTNWSRFSELTGNIIGQTLAMGGMFSFFLESTFLGIFLFGEKIVGKKIHFLSAILIFLGTWLSGLFIIATHSWMQTPVGFEILENGKFVLTNFSALFSNSWLFPSYFHNQAASVVTTSFVVAAVGAYYLLRKEHRSFGKLYVKVGVNFGLFASVILAVPTGNLLVKQVAEHQPVTLAAMEGLFDTVEGAPLSIIGQPNIEQQTLDNKIEIPKMLSFLTYGNWNTEVKGLNDFPKENWPTNITGLYYAYRIMIGLGTIFILITIIGTFFLWQRKLYNRRWFMWILMFAFPFPYIANLAGWYTSELGRQPWLVYNLLRTDQGFSETVSAGSALFTLLGFIGLYTLLGILFLGLVGKIIYQGPEKINLNKAE